MTLLPDKPRRRSIRRELTAILMLISGVALLVACAAFMFYDSLLVRREMRDNLIGLTRVVGGMNTAALQFDDPAASREAVSALSGRPQIMSARIYSTNGSVFAAYVRAGVDPAPLPAPTEDGHRFERDRLIVFQKIPLKNEIIGSIIVESDLEELSRRLRSYIGIALVVLALSSAVALLLSTSLQRLISMPIVHLADTMRKVSDGKNYALRAELKREDEIGDLTRGFNEMLAQIQQRDAQLQSARDDLEKRVVERTSELEQEMRERARAEEAARNSEIRFSSLIQSTNDAIILANSRGEIILWNNGARETFGHEEAEVLGKPLTLLLPESDPRALAQLVAPGPGPAAGKTVELIGRHKSGREFPADLSLTSWRVNEEPVYGAIIRDTTERKESLERLQAVATQLERSNRELQDFAYVASHDLQEPLRKVQAFGDRLQDKYAPQLGEEGLDFISRMQNAAGRMQTLINDLLTFSRVTTKANPFEKVDVARIAREVVSDLEIRIQQSNARIDLGVIPVIEADPLQMRQLLQNLIGNALKFHKDGSNPVVKIASRILKPGDSSLANVAIERESVELTVADNGIGFDEKYLDRIFAVFQRLHGRGVYEGTGIGLAICRKIAERHGGAITARSRPGEGATFIVVLPTHHSLHS